MPKEPKIKSIKLSSKYSDLDIIPTPFYEDFVELAETNPDVFEIEYEKSEQLQTKYRKNGALVFAPKEKINYWSIDSDGRIEQGQWLPVLFPFNKLKFQQGLVFDNKEACQLWADKHRMAYALKQRIVESESQDEYLEYCLIKWTKIGKFYDYETEIMQEPMLKVSTIAKDILMSNSVSDEEFKAFIEVFSL
jgi:hypothetical protein